MISLFSTQNKVLGGGGWPFSRSATVPLMGYVGMFGYKWGIDFVHFGHK